MFPQIQPFYGLGNANIRWFGLYFFPFQASGEDVKNINVATESWKNNESENKQGSCYLTNTLPIRSNQHVAMWPALFSPSETMERGPWGFYPLLPLLMSSLFNGF